MNRKQRRAMKGKRVRIGYSLRDIQSLMKTGVWYTVTVRYEPWKEPIFYVDPPLCE